MYLIARYFLNNSVLELDESAYFLDFEIPNSFGRAFRVWEGVQPGNWRKPIAHRFCVSETTTLRC